MQIGLQHYPVIDLSGTCSPDVISAGRPRVAGTLVHSTAGRNSAAWLTAGSATAGAPASCDQLIDRDGTVKIICPRGSYPYHAGSSRYFIDNKWVNGNQVSSLLLGIELECLWSEAPTYAQIDSLAQRIVAAGFLYGWRWPYLILGHYGVATPEGRRTDPWLFDWGSLMGRLYVTARARDVPGL